jgi:hypothetical protein
MSKLFSKEMFILLVEKHGGARYVFGCPHRFDACFCSYSEAPAFVEAFIAPKSPSPPF